MQKQSIALLLSGILILSFFLSACGSEVSPVSQPTQPAQSSNGSPGTVSQTPEPTTSAVGQTPTPEPTIEGIPTPDNWVTVTIHTTEGGYVRFDPYTLYISAVDVKGIIWANNTDLELTLFNSDIPSKVTPSSLTLAPHASQRLTLPKNEAGQYLFHINDNNGTIHTGGQHCTIVRG